jgi:hypothetical protein
VGVQIVTNTARARPIAERPFDRMGFAASHPGADDAHQ